MKKFSPPNWKRPANNWSRGNDGEARTENRGFRGCHGWEKEIPAIRAICGQFPSLNGAKENSPRQGAQRGRPGSRIPKHAHFGNRTADFEDDADMKSKSVPPVTPAPFAPSAPSVLSAKSALSAVNTPAPKGRNMPAQGNALGNTPPNTSSPEGAKQGGELPKGWIRLTMGEVGRWFGGGTPSKANPRFWTGGKIPWVSPKDMKFDLITDAQDHITEDAVAQSATNLVEEGSILIRNDAEETTDGHGFTRMELSQVGDGSAKPGPSFGGRFLDIQNPRFHPCPSVFIRG